LARAACAFALSPTWSQSEASWNCI
jgi:hypothetical protein